MRFDQKVVLSTKIAKELDRLALQLDNEIIEIDDPDDFEKSLRIWESELKTVCKEVKNFLPSKGVK